MRKGSSFLVWTELEARLSTLIILPELLLIPFVALFSDF